LDSQQLYRFVRRTAHCAFGHDPDKPLGVFFQVGCNKDFAINCLLTLLGCVLVACVPKDLLDVHAFV